MSLRKNTFCGKPHLSLLDICGFVNLWVMSCPFPVLQLQLRLMNQTIVDWAVFCRELVYNYMIVRKVMIGGHGHTVEIDESKIFGRRWNLVSKKMSGL